MFAYKASFEFDWITFIDSLRVCPLFAAKKCYEELDINNVCVQLNLYFSIGKITTLRRHGCIRLEFDMPSVWPRDYLWIWLNSFIWRSFDSLAVKNFMKNWTTTTSAAYLQNPTALLSFQNCLAVIPIFSRETSFLLNWMHPIENLTVI